MSKSQNIIIIEDDETFSLLITHYLKNNLPGVNVYVENSGKKAIESLSRLKPAIIVLDYYLEDELSAKDVMNEILKLDYNPYTILLSSITNEEEKKQVMSMGVREFIPKVNESVYDLVRSIQNALELEQSGDDLNEYRAILSWPVILIAAIIIIVLAFGLYRALI